MGLLSSITDAFKGPLLGGGGSSSKGGGNSFINLLTSLIGGGGSGATGAITSAVLPAALSMMLGGGSTSQPIPVPLGVANPEPTPQNPQGQQTGGQLPRLKPAQFGGEMTPQAQPGIKHSMAWYAGDPSAPMPNMAQLMQQAQGMRPGAESVDGQPTKPRSPYDFNQYFGGQ